MIEPAAAAALAGERPALASLLDRGLRAARSARDPRTALYERALIGPLREFLSRPGKQTRAQLLELAYLAAGGAPGALPPALPLAIEALHAGALIIDDVEDDSETRRGAPALHRTHGVPLAINAANWLYFLAQDLIARAPMPAAARQHAAECTTACLLHCHEGQALDLGTRVFELTQADVPQVVHTISTSKTGALVSLAFELAALAAGASARTRAALAEFGTDAGVVVQMLDDLSGLLHPRRRERARADLRLARATWPWAFLAGEAARDPYEEARGMLRAVCAGAAPDALIALLRLRTGVVGRLRARRALDAACARLSRALGPGATLDALERQLRDLESKHVGQ